MDLDLVGSKTALDERSDQSPPVAELGLAFDEVGHTFSPFCRLKGRGSLTNPRWWAVRSGRGESVRCRKGGNSGQLLGARASALAGGLMVRVMGLDTKWPPLTVAGGWHRAGCAVSCLPHGDRAAHKGSSGRLSIPAHAGERDTHEWRTLAMPVNHDISQHCRMAVLSVLLLLSGCQPSLDSTDAEERKRAVMQTTDQAVLAEVAVRDRDSDVRLAAVEKLTDQAVLGKVAVEVPPPSGNASGGST